MILKGYQYRIYPTEKQKEFFAQHFGCARFVYNWGLARKRDYYAENKIGLSKRALQDELVALKKTDDKLWLNDVNSQTLLSSLGDLDAAYKKFFNKKAQFPRFKRKYDNKQSYQCPQHVKVNFETGLIDLPKIKGVKSNFHRKFAGKIKTCTIRKTPTDKYYISVLVETDANIPISVPVDASQTVGIDLGIKDLLITSSGNVEPNNKFLYKNVRNLKKLQRRLSKKVKKSSNRVKARKRLAKLHEKIANQRLDAVHQASAKLVYKSNDTTFVLEDLNIKGMMKNHKLARAIGDCGWGLFQKMLEYKCKWSGKNLIKIDRWSPSSKTCSSCGHIKDTLALSERTYDCQLCGLIIDRDLNASINIKNFALAKELGLDEPKVKPGDHALAGVIIFDNLAIHGMNQEEATTIIASAI